MVHKVRRKKLQNAFVSEPFGLKGFFMERFFVNKMGFLQKNIDVDNHYQLECDFVMILQ